MSVLIIRHGLSEANNQESLAFGQPQAPLMSAGFRQAQQLGRELLDKHGIDPATDRVAVSKLRRSSQTAEAAGFQDLTYYSSLDEVAHGMELSALRAALNEGYLPPAASTAAEALLLDPPAERVWVTHGLVIGGLCRVLGVHQDARLTPKFCEIRELPITPRESL